jgi:cytidylate kinase
MPALLADIKQRDLSDSIRKLSPLLPADDAHIIDSSDMTLDEVFSYAENLIKKEYL